MKPVKLKISKTTPVVPPLILSRGALGWLIFALLLAISYHIPHTPIWAVAAVPVMLTWRYRLFVRKQPLPPQTIRVILALAAFGGVMASYHSYLGRDPGITALILLSTLKLFELKSQRDFMFAIFLAYFLVFGNFLYDQTIQALAFMVAAVILITATVLRLNHGEKEPVKISFLVKSGFRFFLYAIPFMVVLFAFFPRSSVPLWNLPHDSGKRGQSGFNDTVFPGQIAELAASNQTVFRVVFPDNNMPAFKDLYFRGLVLWFTNGKGWFQGTLSFLPGRRLPIPEDNIIRQEITLEPQYEHWLFALDLPVDQPRGSQRLPGRIIQAYWPVSEVITYGVASVLHPKNPEPRNEVPRWWPLQLPEKWNSPMLELARSWRAAATSDAEVVQAALDYFKRMGFEYSLTPGTLDPQAPLEDFLFNKRKGYCEHYAATFTLLMRAAGIPSRMVVGFQGGEVNSVGGYLVVRQADAHAWSEVWLEGKGWQRVDPTAVVSPERVEFGAEMSRTLSAMGRLQGEDISEAIQRAMRKGFFEKVSRFFKDHWDNINIKWEVWIMSYDRFRQRAFLRGVGLADVGRWSYIVVLLIIIPALFFLVSLLLKRQTTAADPLVKLYRRFYSKTAKMGIRPAPCEGPQVLQLRVVDAFPHKAEEIREII
ncbi:MAG: protein-glutamine gamma-glutamyltransferase, partial [Acidobacteriota bacterium]|nr:protein-glutamine gamma-glutamyltransferase [Acidobacteriota bacterium]